MRVAFVYDRVNKFGGAERVLLALHEMFPEAPLYTSVYNAETAPWAKVFPKIYTSFLQSFPLAKTSHELYPMLMPLAFESFTFDEYDLVISVTSEAAKGIITKPQTAHVCYCLTPTRYLWSGFGDYFQNSVFRFFTKPIVSYLQAWDKDASQRPDYYIAISKEVQKRVKKYYGRESVVIYPPVTIRPRGVLADANHLGGGRMDSPEVNFFLIVSRLVPYKRIDIAVEAFNNLGWPLKIVGSGSEFAKLKSMARKNIEFLGNLTDSELKGYYEDCISLIVPGIEDFGLAAIEAQAMGKPVIAFRVGGSLETIIEGKTGEFFYPQTTEALARVVKDFNDKNYSREECRKNTERFSKKRFKEEFMNIIKRLV